MCTGTETDTNIFTVCGGGGGGGGFWRSVLGTWNWNTLCDRRYNTSSLNSSSVSAGGCLLSLLTNSALLYEPKCGGRGKVAGSQPLSTTVHMEPK